MSSQRKTQKTFSLATAIVAGLLATTAADRVSAQARPAYTKNVDEAGRLPYEVEVEFQPGNCLANCFNYLGLIGGTGGGALFFDGPPIPAGKRAVIVWISAGLPSNGTVNRIVLQSQRSITAFGKQKWSYSGPFFLANVGGRPQAGMSSGSFVTYGPGESPHFYVEVSNVIAFSGSIILSGYLIDATN